MKHHFVTTFDKENFLIRGLALYHSLKTHGGDFELFVLCMDPSDTVFFRKISLPHLTPLPLEEVEDAALLSIKIDRTLREYCLTLKPAVILHLLERCPDIESLAWLDADLYFYSDIRTIYDELGEGSALLTRSYFAANRLDQEKLSGIYNAGFMIFRNDHHANAALSWWKGKCIEWCYGRREDGKYGEQAYLDELPRLFAGIKVSSHHGANVAYWNSDLFEFFRNNQDVRIREKTTCTEFPLLFFHFSGVTLYRIRNKVRIISNRRVLDPDIRSLVYTQYETGLSWALSLAMKHVNKQFAHGMKDGAPYEYMLKRLRTGTISRLRAIHTRLKHRTDA